MNLATFFQRTTRQHGASIAAWVGLAVFVSVLPVIMAWIGTSIWGRSLSLREFVVHGEAAIFSLGVLFPVFNQTLKDMRVRFVLKGPVTWAAIILVLCAVTLYSSIATGVASFSDSADQLKLNEFAVICFSLLVYIGSVLVGACAHWIHIVREQLDKEEMLAEAVQSGSVDLKNVLDEPTRNLRSQVAQVEDSDG